MNQAVGTIDPDFNANGAGHHSGAPTLPTTGPWLTSQYTVNKPNSPWDTYGKATDVHAPSPSMLWVLLDEDAKGLNDAAFAFGMEQSTWIDLPGVYHNGGCGFAFADGHSETHHWLSGGEKETGDIEDTADYNDWLWMRERTSADSTGTMTTPSPP
jgi:prepilin-type processing-associated H-X9-DG protein